MQPVLLSPQAEPATAARPLVIDARGRLGDARRLVGEWQGGAGGAAISLVANYIAKAGEGVQLHRHPYAETFVVQRGRVCLTTSHGSLVAEAGQIVVVPGGVAHGFTSLGPEPLEMLDIHESGSFVTEWLA